MDEVKTMRFVNVLVKRPCLVALGTLGLTMLCLLAFADVVMQEGMNIFNTGDSSDLNDIRTIQRDALALAQGDLGVEIDKEKEESKEVFPLTERGDFLMLVYVAGSGDIFTEAAIRQMREVEDRITQDAHFPEYCLRPDRSGNSTACQAPLSPTRLFYAAGLDMAATVENIDALDGKVDGDLAVFRTGNLTQILQTIQHVVTAATKRGPAGVPGLNQATIESEIARATGASPITVLRTMQLFQLLTPVMVALGGTMPIQDEMQDRKAVLQLAAAMKGETFYKGLVDYFFDKGFEAVGLRSAHTRATIQFGVPLEGYASKNDRRQEQQEKLSKWFQSSFRSFLEETSKDGEVEVLYFATPLVGDEILAILQQDLLMALVSVAFVFIWLRVHSGSFFLAIAGMLEILLSIPVAFVLYRSVLGFQYFDTMNAMTLFVVLAIGADDIFVLMDAYHQALYHAPARVDFRARMTWSYRRAAGAMFVTSFTTMAAFAATAASPLIDVQSFGAFAACVIFVDYLLVITWFPACLVFYHNHLESRTCCLRRSVPGTSTDRAYQAPRLPVTSQSEDSVDELCQGPKKRFAERFLGGPFADFVVKRRVLILGFFVVVAAGTAGVGSQIQAATSTDQMLPSDHPFQRIFDIMGEEFPSSAQEANAKVHLVWGLAGVDRTGVNLLRDSENKGVVVYDEAFIFDEAAQEHLLGVCEEVLHYGEEVSGFLSMNVDAVSLQGKLDCPLLDFKAWLQEQGKPFPVPTSEVGAAMAAFLQAPAGGGGKGKAESFGEKWNGYLGFPEPEGRLRFIVLTVESILRDRSRRNSHDVLEEQYMLFEAWVGRLNARGPKSADGATHLTANSMWVWMHTQTVFVSSAIAGMASGVALAFVVVLLATQQILVAVASMLTIGGVLASVLGAVVALGWELGTIESICLTILAGFSVDYVVHLAHSYVHAKQSTRAEKTRATLDEIGVSVLGGMLTSVSAGAALMMCQLQFFAKFGTFLLLTVALSWLWANLGFMAAMALFGPDTSTPQWLQNPAAGLVPQIRLFLAKAKQGSSKSKVSQDAVIQVAEEKA